MNAASEKPEATALSVVLKMDDATRAQLAQSEGALEVAKAYEIVDAASAELANTELRQQISALARIEEVRKGFVAPARQIIEHAQALFNPGIEGRKGAIAYLKNLLGVWTQKEQERVAAERRAAEDAARKARAEAEAAAAAARAKAEQEAAEMRRQAAEAEERRKKLESEGKAKEAAKAAAEAARKEEEARARQQEGEVKAGQAILAAAAVSSSQPAVVEAAAPAGFGTRDNWQVELERDEAYAIAQIAAILPTKPELIGLLKLDLSAANKMAKALKKAMNVPGLRVVNNPTSVSRKG